MAGPPPAYTVQLHARGPEELQAAGQRLTQASPYFQVLGGLTPYDFVTCFTYVQ